MEDIFRDARDIRLVTTVINSSGADTKDKFSRTNEFIYFIMYGDAQSQPMALPAEWYGNIRVNKGLCRLCEKGAVDRQGAAHPPGRRPRGDAAEAARPVDGRGAGEGAGRPGQRRSEPSF